MNVHCYRVCHYPALCGALRFPAHIIFPTERFVDVSRSGSEGRWLGGRVPNTMEPVVAAATINGTTTGSWQRLHNHAGCKRGHNLEEAVTAVL